MSIDLRVSHKATSDDTRSVNRRLVLQQLFDGRMMSRAELARMTRLTPAVISALAADLVADGLVEECDPPSDIVHIGTPSTLLRLAGDACCVIALALSHSYRVSAGVVDLAGNVSHYTDVEFDDPGELTVAGVLETTLKGLMEVAPSPIVGIGVSAPGLVRDDGTVIETTSFGWKGVPLQNVFRFAQLPVYVVNDANACALAEYSRGVDRYPHMVAIRIDFGVGCGIILNNRLFAGLHFGAGEIGHFVVDADGPLCSCGHNGCLETYLGVENLKAAMARPGATADDVLRDAAGRLGVALGALVSILDVGAIVVSGPEELLGPNFCHDVAVIMRRHCFKRLGDQVDVRFSSFGENALLLGASALVLSNELGVA